MTNRPTANQISYLIDLTRRTQENLRVVSPAERRLSYEAKLDPVEKARREVLIHAAENDSVTPEMKLAEIRRFVPREDLQRVRTRVLEEMIQETWWAVEARAALTAEEISEMTAEEVSATIDAIQRQPW